MKQIISYNSEYDDMCAVTAVTEEEAPAAFRAYVKERAVELLEITENEAEELLGINGDIEEGLVYNEETCSALFLLPTGVSEVLRVIDIPETDTEKGQDAPEIARVLTLSTAHLRKETAEMMDSDCREELSMLSIYPKIALPLQVIGKSSPEEIDVNISPTKTEVKFAEDSVVFQTLFAAIKEALGYGAVAGDLDFDNPEAGKIPVLGSRFEEYTPSTIPSAGVDPHYDPFAGFPAPSASSAPREKEPSFPDFSHVDRKEDYGKLFDDRTLASSSVIPVHGRYILAPSKTGVMVVHVRRARERIFYDRFLKALSRETHATQTALFPVRIEVGAANRTVFDGNADLLASLGFDIVPFGTDTIVVNGVPEGYSSEPGKVEVMVGDLLLILSENHNALPEMMESALAAKFAALGAAGGEPVSSPLEARRLYDALMASANPEFTSGGKRIISILPTDELDKRF